MASPARILGTLPTTGIEYLGPANVVELRGGSVEAHLPDGSSVVAKLALAYLYEPAEGDVLLVIGKGSDHYAIGVLHAKGRAVLALQGDVELRAVDGELRLSGDRGVKVQGPEVNIDAGRIRMIADSISQKVHTLYQRVSDLLSVHAQTSHTVVDRSMTTQAESATIQTTEVMTINGKQIHLG